MEDIQQRVIKIVADQLGLEESKIKPELKFVDDLGADSLDTVELVMSLEDYFDISIPDETAEKITTVGEAVERIREEIKSNSGPESDGSSEAES